MTTAPKTHSNDGLDGILDSGLLAGLSPAALAEEFGTPFYVYDLDLIGRRVEALRALLPRGFRIAFAVKANPSLAVVAHLRRCGVGADVASGGELETVLRAGFDPSTIAMTGPGKREEELAAAVAAGIGFVTVESPGELHRLEAVAAAAGKRQKILLRLAVSEDARLETVRIIGGVEGKFGMPLGTLIETARAAARSQNVELLGVHAFGASNLRDAELLVGHIADLVEVGRRVAAEAGTQLRVVDAGGGLGIPYSGGERPLDLDRLCRRLGELRTRWDSDSSSTAASITFCGRPSSSASIAWPCWRRTGPEPWSTPPWPAHCARASMSSPRARCCPGRAPATWWRCWTREPTASRNRCPSSCRTRLRRRWPSGPDGPAS